METQHALILLWSHAFFKKPVFAFSKHALAYPAKRITVGGKRRCFIKKPERSVSDHPRRGPRLPPRCTWGLGDRCATSVRNRLAVKPSFTGDRHCHVEARRH
jgi:hypothetical protein